MSGYQGILNPVIAGSKVVRVSRELTRAHSKNMKDIPFFEITLLYSMGDLHYLTQPHKRRVMAITYEGPDIVERIIDFDFLPDGTFLQGPRVHGIVTNIDFVFDEGVNIGEQML